jgi:twinkle protein
VRRLLPSRCLFVTYPEGCKDLGDVLKAHGPAGVAEVLNGKKPYPVHGIYKLGDYPPAPALQTYSTGWELLDEHVRIYAGEFMVVTGIPSMGKSTWSMNLLVNLYRQCGWRSAVFSPEMPTVPEMRDKLRKIIGGARADDVIHDAFTFIDIDPTGKIDEDFTVDLLIRRAIEAVMRDGIKVFLIDPWNEVEHARGKGELMGDYISRAIRELKGFARQYEVAVIVIVHPNKDVFEKGRARMPTLYDCDGSASWFNKPDHGICVHRDDPSRNEATIAVQKVRHEGTGRKGCIKMAFDERTCRYTRLDAQQEGGGHE